MVGIERFEQLLRQAMQALPEPIFEHLNLGVSVVEDVKLNPHTPSGQPAVILGEYHVRRHLGRGIVLYYGSFLHLYPQLTDEAEALEQISCVLKHELTHHLEHLAGEQDLVREDARQFWNL